MVSLDPIPDSAAAIAPTGEERLLVIADYHAGFEAAMRYQEGIELPSRAPDRRERLLELLARTNPDRLVILGDLMHSIGGPGGAERGELEVLFEEVSVPVTLIKGNHDGIIEELVAANPSTFAGVEVSEPRGLRLGSIGFAHGHTWPSREVLRAELVCIGHEHPRVRLEDDVGGSRNERVWLRGQLTGPPFTERDEDIAWNDPELVVFPAFNELCGGTWINVPAEEFLAPFLPSALPVGDVYLLDGTYLGEYRF